MEVTKEVVQKMQPGPDRDELLKQLRVKALMQKAFDKAESQFRPDYVLTLEAKYLTIYETIKGIADRLLSLEIQIMELVFRSEDPALNKYHCGNLTPNMSYRRKWNDLNFNHFENILRLMVYTYGPMTNVNKIQL